MEIRAEFISASCNLTYNCVELTHQLIIFGANHALTIYDLQDKKVVKTFVEHVGRISCVRLLRKSHGKHVLTSGADGQLLIWHNFEDDSVPDSKFRLEVKVRHCSNPQTPITVCDGIYLSDIKSTVGYITSLSKVFIGTANLSVGDFKVFQEVDLKRSIAMDIVFEDLSGDEVLLMGMDSGEVALYGQLDIKREAADEKFVKISTLNKHEDWVRCLAITTLDNGDRLLATGGQDSFIAVWRFKVEEVAATDFEFQVVEFKNKKIVFDSMIIGHEGWVNSLQWNDNGELISCSSDQTIIIWENIEQIWVEKIRLGVVGGQTVGGFCARFNDHFVITSGMQGAIQIWSWSEELEDWIIEPSITGHYKSVSDLDYDLDGRYVVTTSEDQTSRIFAPWGQDRWHEVSRPQVHGHDIFALKCAKGDYIVSGAEEKILRAFQPSEIFVANYEDMVGSSISLQNVSESASVPALGLSNLTDEEHLDATTKRLEERLDEDFLRSRTLWTECSKLYGHGFEICAIGASRVDPIVVSGCRSTTQQFSSLILWSGANFKNLGEFPFHKLNVTDLEFSRDGKRLLSTSRDRTWALWNVIGPDPDEGQENFSVTLVENGSGHSRALTVGTWAPNGNFFVTGGRDKKLIAWKLEKPEVLKGHIQIATEVFQQAVTAAAVNQDNIVAVGLESGIISILSLNSVQSNQVRFESLMVLTHSEAHHGVVTRMKFSPSSKWELASASADQSVKIHRLIQSPVQ